MTFELDRPALNRRQLRRLMVRFCHLERQTLGSPTRFEKFRQWCFDDRKAALRQDLLQAIAGFIHHHHSIDIDRITGKIHRVRFLDRNPFLRRNAQLDQPIGIGIKGGRIIQQISIRQRTKTSIQVIKPPIYQSQREYFDIQPLG